MIPQKQLKNIGKWLLLTLISLNISHAPLVVAQSQDSEGAVVSILPVPPENAAVSHNSLTEVELTWDASLSPPASIGSYSIFYKLTSDLNYPLLPQITRVDSLASYTETITVLANTGYDFKIYANTIAGVSSSDTCASCEVSNNFCGNGAIEPSESCDGVNLGGAVCTDFGYTGGSLACNLSCNYVFSSCTSPGGGGGGGGTPQDLLEPISGEAQSPAYANESPILISYFGANDPGFSGLDYVELWYKKGTGPWINTGLQDTGASGSFDFSPPFGTNDTYYFDLVAHDKAGNTSDSPSGSGDTQTVYDTVNPTIESIQMPATATGPIGITYVNAIDPAISEVSHVELWYKKGENGVWLNTGQTGPAGSATLLFDGFTESDAYYFDLIAVDLANNQSTETYEFQSPVLYDVDPPAFNSSQISQVVESSLFIAYDGAQDIGPAGLKGIELWYRHESSGTWLNSGLVQTGESGLFEFTPPEGDGVYFFEFVLEDDFGNRTEIPIGDGHLSVAVSNLSFDIVLTNLPDRVTLSNSAMIGVTGNNVVAYRYRLNDGSFSTERVITQAIELGDLEEGIQRLQVIGKSIEGVWQSEDQATSYVWRVDYSQPRVNIVGPFLPYIIKERTIIKSATYELYYSNHDQITLTERDISLASTGTAGGSMRLAQKDESTWTVEISNIVGVGTLRVVVAPGTARHSNGNVAEGATSTPLNVDIQFLEDDPLYVQLLEKIKPDIVPQAPNVLPSSQSLEKEAQKAIEEQILISGQAFKSTLPKIALDPATRLLACQRQYPNIDFESLHADDDNDMLPNRSECLYSTHPLIVDSDEDTCSDGLEVNWLGTHPLEPRDCPFSGNQKRVWITTPQSGWSIPALEIMGLTPDDTSFTDLFVFPVTEGEAILDESINIGRIEGFNASQVPEHLFFELDSNAILKEKRFYDLVAVSTLQSGELVHSIPVRIWLDSNINLAPPTPTSIGGTSIKRLLKLTNIRVDPTENGKVRVTGESEYGAQVFAIWQSTTLSSSTIVDSQLGRFSIESPEPLELNQEHQVTLYALKAEEGQTLKSKNVRVNFFLYPYALIYYLIIIILFRVILLIITRILKKYEENIDSRNKFRYNLDSNKTKTLFYNQNKMNKVMQNTLAVLGGAALGIVGFNLYVGAQTDSDTIQVSVTIPGTVTIADDGVDLTIGALVPNVVNDTNLTTLSVTNNDTDGFAVTVLLEDLNGTTGQLCSDGGGGLTCGVNTFDADNGAVSYLSVTSNASAGGLGALAGATFLAAETNLGDTAIQVYTAAATTNTDTFDVEYDVFADNSVTPDTYLGVITFTINAL